MQLICAFRLLAPEVELSLSTRESPFFVIILFRWLSITLARLQEPNPVVMLTIIKRWNNLLPMITAVQKPSPKSCSMLDFNLFGKIGITI